MAPVYSLPSQSELGEACCTWVCVPSPPSRWAWLKPPGDWLEVLCLNKGERLLLPLIGYRLLPSERQRAKGSKGEKLKSLPLLQMTSGSWLSPPRIMTLLYWLIPHLHHQVGSNQSKRGRTSTYINKLCLSFGMYSCCGRLVTMVPTRKAFLGYSQGR